MGPPVTSRRCGRRDGRGGHGDRGSLRRRATAARMHPVTACRKGLFWHWVLALGLHCVGGSLFGCRTAWRPASSSQLAGDAGGRIDLSTKKGSSHLAGSLFNHSRHRRRNPHPGFRSCSGLPSRPASHPGRGPRSARTWSRSNSHPSREGAPALSRCRLGGTQTG